MDWHFRSRSHHCDDCEAAFEDKQPYRTILFRGMESLERRDTCPGCWEQKHKTEPGAMGGYISHWQGVYEVPPPPPEATDVPVSPPASRFAVITIAVLAVLFMVVAAAIAIFRSYRNRSLARPFQFVALSSDEDTDVDARIACSSDLLSVLESTASSDSIIPAID